MRNRTRTIPRAVAGAVCAGALATALALPALAGAQPNRHQVGAVVPPGSSLNLTFGTVPKGQFAFGLKVSSDGPKTLRLTQKRDNGSRFTVLALPSPAASGACQGAAGTIVCTGITTPVTPGGHSWNIRLRNGSNRPMNVVLTVVWKAVGSAG